MRSDVMLNLTDGLAVTHGVKTAAGNGCVSVVALWRN